MNGSNGAHVLPSSLKSHYPVLSRPPTRQRPLHIVLAATGSVASVKIRDIVATLLERYGAQVRIFLLLTSTAKHFVDVKQLQDKARRRGWKQASRAEAETEESRYSVRDLAEENAAGEDRHDAPLLKIWDDTEDWSDWKKVGDPVLHIELRRWADVVLVAPCSANTLAKIAGGLCDNLLTSMLRALSPTTPTYLFPAMNTLMYMHPLTEAHLKVAQDVLGYQVVGPISKQLACGDVGQGAMTEWRDIVDLVAERFGLEGQGDEGKR